MNSSDLGESGCIKVKLFSKAIFFTGEGFNFLPLPEGLSTDVMTHTT